jgi:ABC-type Zn uptake system ZnuABC Zn-binding protein ZnuA
MVIRHSRFGFPASSLSALVPLLAIVLVALVASPVAYAAGQREAADDAPHADAHAADHGEDHDHDDSHHDGIEPADLSDGRLLRVVATTSILGDVVRTVAGDAAEVTVLMAVGQNPHGYTPTPRAIAAIERADMVILNGFDLEENLVDVVETTSRGYVVEASAGISPIGAGEEHDDHDADHDDDHDDDHDADHDDHDDHDHDADHDDHDDHDHDADHDDDHDDDHDADHDDHNHDDHIHAAGDPHVWFDPTNVLSWVDTIEDALSAADPARATTFAANAATYRSRLTELDRMIRREVEAIPPARRKLVLDHASLDYFARRYGFEMIGAVIPATTDQAEPSARDVARLVEQVREEAVPAVFVGGTASRGMRNMVDAVAAEVGRNVRVGVLLTGSLAPEGQPGDTYLSFMEYNVSQIVENLKD